MTAKPKKKFALPKTGGKLSKKAIAIGSACIAVLLVVAIVLGTVLLRGRGAPNYALYVKDNGVYYLDASGAESWPVTEQLLVEDSLDDEELSYFAPYLGYYIYMSEDGKHLFYVDRFDDTQVGMTLSYRDADDPEQEPIRIDTEVIAYAVNDAGDCVTYLKGEEGALYQHDLSDKEKLDSDVVQFYASDDGEKIYYVNTENELFLKCAGTEAEKLDSDVEYVYSLNEAFDTVYYEKEDALYKKTEGADKVRIATDVASVLGIYETGEAYYVKNNPETTEMSLLDFVEDDLRESDAAMTEPEYPEYPSYWSYDTMEAYEAAVDQYDAAYDEYLAASELYYEKLERDELREALAEETGSVDTRSLYYYNGTEEQLLTDAYGGSYNTFTDAPRTIYSVVDLSDITIKMSEIEYASDVEDLVEEALYTSAAKWIAVQGTAAAIEQTEADMFLFDSEGETVYFVDNFAEETEEGELYAMPISADGPQQPELYDSGVNAYSITITENNRLLYYKAVEGDEGELYVDKEFVDYDVSRYHLNYIEEDDSFVYMTDWNDSSEYGTLKIFRKGEAETIADDVHAFSVTPDGEVLYLYDYSTDYMHGSLYLYDGEAGKIDDDVVALIPVWSNETRDSIQASLMSELW